MEVGKINCAPRLFKRNRLLIVIKGKCYASCNVCLEEEGKVGFIIEMDRIVS